MAGARRVPIPRTERHVWPGSRHADPLGAGSEIDLTVWLRPRRGGDVDAAAARALGAIAPGERRYEERAALARATGADPADLEILRRYCERFGIEVVGTHWRCATVAGPIERLVRAFGATVAIFEDDQRRRFRHRSGALHVAPELGEILRGVFGLHQWPRSKHVRSLERHATPLLAREVAARYGFPDGDGGGQTIGVVQLRGGFNADDFDRCMLAQGVSARRPSIVHVDRATVAHDAVTTKDLEAALDVQVIAALAPQAQVVVYEAPDNERGFLDALREAVFGADAPAIVSVSYGWPENVWTPAALDIADELFAAAALLGVTILCSSGDDGAALDAAGKPHVLAPASNPFVVACGATAIVPAGEAAWERSGGGFSERFALPDWQAIAGACAARYGVPAGRGVPDVAAQQSPGYYVVVEGTELAIGGTSAVAPVWAALIARINQRLGVAAGFFSPILYRHAGDALFGAVTEGNNGRFDAGETWNPCTGLGTPKGAEIEAALH